MRRVLRTHIPLAFALTVSMFQARSVGAAWQRDGIPLTPAFVSSGPSIGSDGAGGIFLTWVPAGNGSVAQWSNKQVWAQRILANGSIAPSWPDTGVMIATATQPGALDVETIDGVIPDGSGGAFVEYEPYITHELTASLAHVTASGADLNGWPVFLGYADQPAVAVDDSRGVFFGYHGFDYYGWATGVYFNRLRPNGSRAGSQQVALLQGTVYPSIDTDHAGGAFACWLCELEGIDSTLTQVWDSGPWPGCTANMALTSDGGRGAFLAWVSGTVVKVSRVDSDGSVVSGWTAGGLMAGSGDSYTPYRQVTLVRDGAGGFFVQWGTQNATRVQRITAFGAIAAGWAAGGTVLGPTASSYPLTQLVPDGDGGIYAGWVENRGPVTGGDIYAQHLSAAGSPAPGWIATGDPICTAVGDQNTVSAAPDGAGGVYFAWMDLRQSRQIYGQHLLKDDVIPLAVPLSHATAPSLSVRTNPSPSTIVCSFELPTAEMALIEVFDTAGRRLCERTVEGATGGPRVAPLHIEGSKPGVYLIRLTQAGLTAATRVVVIR